MKLKLTQPWGDYQPGATIDPPRVVAERLIGAQIAVAAGEEAETSEAECAIVEAPEDAMRRPIRRRRTPRKRVRET